MYLICHETSTTGVNWLWLEDDQGQVACVSANDLASHFRQLRYRPQLVVLASCDSAGDGEGPIGPRLTGMCDPVKTQIPHRQMWDLLALTV